MIKLTAKCLVAAVLTGSLVTLSASIAQSAPTVISRGLPTTSYTASSVSAPTASYGAEKAFDDPALHPTTRWLAGFNATELTSEWIEVDLGKVYDLDQLFMTLYLSSGPVSATFEIFADTDPIRAANALPDNLIATIASPPLTPFVSHQQFSVTTAGILPARYVQVRTLNEHLSSNPAAYVRPSWLDITVTGESQSVPEPSTLILLGFGLSGLAFLKRRRG